MAASHHSRPDPMDTADDVLLTVAAVASRLGVAAATLRTWDRRYGLGPSRRTAGNHRRYDSADIGRLETMRRLTLDGVSPAEAARIATRGAVTALHTRPSAVADETHDIMDPLTLAAASVETDEGRVRRIVGRAVRERSLLTAWRTLVHPALELLRGREHADLPGHDPEGALRAAMLAAVRETTPADVPTRGGVLIHPARPMQVDAHVLAGELAHRGLAARVLRPTLRSASPDSVVAAARAADARLVVILGTPDDADAVVRAVDEAGAVVFVISLTEVTPTLTSVYRARTLAGAVHEIESLLLDPGESRDDG